jgi:hypothetical protein
MRYRIMEAATGASVLHLRDEPKLRRAAARRKPRQERSGNSAEQACRVRHQCARVAMGGRSATRRSSLESAVAPVVFVPRPAACIHHDEPTAWTSRCQQPHHASGEETGRAWVTVRNDGSRMRLLRDGTKRDAAADSAPMREVRAYIAWMRVTSASHRYAIRRTPTCGPPRGNC